MAEWENLGSRDGRQKGTYRGVRTGVHCHFVGGNDHLQIGDDRYPVRWKRSDDNHNKDKLLEIDLLRGAWSKLKAKGDASAGVPDVKLWLKSYLIDYHGVNASKIV